MFTGIVEELGQVKALSLRGNSGTLTVKAKKVLEGTKIGDSIAVNGVCLTVTNMKNNEFSCRRDGGDSEEKQPRSTLGWKLCKPGAGHGGRRSVWRSYRFRSH